MVMSDELWRLSARDMIELLKSGEITPLEAIDAAEARIAETDGDVNAMVTRCYERARDHAKSLMAAGFPDDPGPGYLYGLPISIKDLSKVAGVRSTMGSPIFADQIPETSDLLVLNLEQKGGVVVGKSNTPEFGAGGNTFNEVFGATRNPWDTRMNCGGSSGGAAVNLATGQVWLAQGSDMGGSLRTPASYCSVVGLRPSPGRCRGHEGASAFSGLGVVGPMARNVADAALMLDAMSGEERRDPLSLPAPAEPFLAAALAADVPARIAWTPDLGGVAPVEPEVARICEAAARTFSGLGAGVEEAAPDLSDAQSCFQGLRAVSFAVRHLPYFEQEKDKMKPELIWNIEKGMDLNLLALAQSQHQQARLYANMCDFFESYDLLVAPTVTAAPREVEIRYLEEVAGTRFDNYVDWMIMAYAITLTQCPAISLPCGFTESGLPVGLQLVAPPHGEARLLSAAAALEAELGIAPGVPMDPIRRH
jgi:amidase